MTTTYRSPLFMSYLGFPGAGTQFYIPLGCGGMFTSTNLTNEAYAKTKFYRDGTLANLRCVIQSNSDASSNTLIMRKNATSNGNGTITIGAGQTGYFEDTTNTDAVTANDYWHVSVPIATSNAVKFTFIGADFKCTQAISKIINGGIQSNIGTTASTSYYTSLVGIQTSTIPTTNDNKYRCYVPDAGTVKNLRIYVSVNTRSSSATTLTLVHNGSDTGITISVSASGTGEFEDTSHTVSVAAGDYLYYRFDTGSGAGTMTVQHMSIDIENTTAGSCSIMGYTGSAGINVTTTDRYNSIIGGGYIDRAVAQIAQAQMKLRGTGTIKNLYGYVPTNSFSQTVNSYAQIGGSNTAVTFAVTTTSTGLFSDTSHSVTYADGDLLNGSLQRSTSGSGTFNITNFSLNVVADGESSGGIFNPYYYRMLGNSGSGMNV